MNKKYFPLLVLFFFVILVKKNQKKISLSEGLYSIKNQNTNIYYGPSLQFDISYKILHKNYPIIILETKKNWVKIKDKKEVLGWVLKNKIGKPYALVLKKITFTDEKIIILPNSYIEFLEEISEKFCKIKVNEKTLTTKCDNLWYKN